MRPFSSIDIFVKLVIGGTCGDVNVILSDVNGFILALDIDICRGVLVEKNIAKK